MVSWLTWCLLEGVTYVNILAAWLLPHQSFESSQPQFGGFGRAFLTVEEVCESDGLSAGDRAVGVRGDPSERGPQEDGLRPVDVFRVADAGFPGGHDLQDDVGGARSLHSGADVGEAQPPHIHGDVEDLLVESGELL